MRGFAIATVFWAAVGIAMLFFQPVFVVAHLFAFARWLAGGLR